MARIRTIKPEFWTSTQVVECSPSARLLFIGAWNFCDDAGVHPADCRRLKMEVFPGDSITVDAVQVLVSELLAVGLLNEYEVNRQKFWEVTGWRHQKIDKPTYKHPKNPKLVDLSMGRSGSLPDESGAPRQVIVDSSPPDRNGGERSLIDADDARCTAAEELVSTSQNDMMNSVLDAYQDVHGVRPPGGRHLIQIIQQRVSEYGKAADPNWWQTYFYYANQDLFLAGQKIPGFKANLLYLLKPDVFARVIEAAQREEVSHG